MDNRSRTIATFPIPGAPDTFVVVTVHYPTIPGIRREYSISAQPTRIETHEHGTIRRYNPREGYRRWIEAAPRYSAKRLETIAADPETIAFARSMYRTILIDRGFDYIEAEMIALSTGALSTGGN
jgi:hypothetical protein